MATFKLTPDSKISFGVKLFRIEAIVDIPARGVKKGDKGGFVEKESNLSGNARVYGDAQVSLKREYKKGLFLHTSNKEIKATVIDQSKEDDFNPSNDYKNLLVVGNYEITNIEPQQKPQTINIGGKNYEVTEELTKALNNLKELKW